MGGVHGLLQPLLEPCCGGSATGESRDNEEHITRNATYPGIGGYSGFTVNFDKSSGERLGLQIGRTTGDELRVVTISGGMAERWNMNCHSDQRISEGDIVVEVNGESSSPQAMLERMEKDTQVEIRLLPGGGGSNGASTAHVPPNVEDEYAGALFQLTEMGHPEMAAREALIATGGDFTQALAILSVEQGQEDDFVNFVPPPDQGGPEDGLERLVGVGFPEEEARNALRLNNGNLNQAIVTLAGGDADAGGREQGGGHGGDAGPPVDPTSLQMLVSMGFP